MLDGVGTRFNTITQTLSAESVAGRLLAVAVGFIDDGRDLFFREGRIAKQFAVGLNFVASGRVELNPIRTIVNLFTYRLARSPRAIHSLIIAWQVYFRGTQHTFPGRDQSHGGNLHPRPRKNTAVNDSLDVHIGIAA